MKDVKPIFFATLAAATLAVPLAHPPGEAVGAGAAYAAQPEATPGLKPQKNSQGAVTVTVAPLDLSPGAKAWSFEVELNTHVAELAQDLAAVSVLTDASGGKYQPIAWEGDPPGGHHRKGVLKFKPITPRPQSISLKIRDMGGPGERVFTWSLSPQ